MKEAFSATYSDWRLIKGRKVVQVVFEVPLEAAGNVHDILGGMPDPSKSVWCAIARLKEPKEVMPDKQNEGAQKNISPPVNIRPAAKKSWHELSPAQQAGILCAHKGFQVFLGLGRKITEEEAAHKVRHYCGVESRSEISRENKSGEAWQEIVGKFRAWETAIEPEK